MIGAEVSGQPIDEALKRQQEFQSERYQQELERRPILPPPDAAGACVDTSKSVTGTDIPLPDTTESERTDPQFVFERLDIRGVTVLSAPELREIEARYTGRPVPIYQTIDAVIADITALYVEKGYILARAYIPPDQNIQSGTLIIQVIEVSIEDIDVYENDIERGYFGTAFPSLRGRLFNLRDIEQGLEQINRLPSKQAKIDIVPTEAVDTTRIKVCTDTRKSWRVASRIDNSGSRSSGERQVGTDFQVDDLFHLYEAWNLHYQRDAESNTPGTESISVSGGVSVPVGYCTGSLSASRHRYVTILKGAAQDFRSTGSEANVSGRFGCVFHRDSRSINAVSITLGHMNTESFVEELRLLTASRALTTVRMGVDHRRVLFGGSFYGLLGLERGVGWFGALEDHNPRRDIPNARFLKLDLDLNYSRDTVVGSQLFQWTVRTVGHWAPHALFNSEQLFVGGRQTVRGFRGDSLSGEVGGFLSNSLTYPVPLTLPHLLGRLQLTAGIDIGRIWRNYGDSSEESTLSGTAVAIAIVGGTLQAELVWEWGLSAPTFLTADDDVFRFKFGLSF